MGIIRAQPLSQDVGKVKIGVPGSEVGRVSINVLNQKGGGRGLWFLLDGPPSACPPANTPGLLSRPVCPGLCAEGRLASLPGCDWPRSAVCPDCRRGRDPLGKKGTAGLRSPLNPRVQTPRPQSVNRLIGTGPKFTACDCKQECGSKV